MGFNKDSCVAVCTLNDNGIKLPAEKIAMAGTCYTENVGIENIVKAVIANPKIRFLVLCGAEPEKRFSGYAIKCLVENGVEENGRIIGAKGLMPFLKQLTDSEIAFFRKQVSIVDYIGSKDADVIEKAIDECLEKNPGEYKGPKFESREIETIEGGFDYVNDWTADDKPDENWFIIKVDRENKRIVAEHYTGYGENTKRCCNIVGTKAEVILATIVKLKKVEKLYHAGYLGKELQKAEIALKKGIKYNQELEFDI